MAGLWVSQCVQVVLLETVAVLKEGGEGPEVFPFGEGGMRSRGPTGTCPTHRPWLCSMRGHGRQHK